MVTLSGDPDTHHLGVRHPFSEYPLKRDCTVKGHRGGLDAVVYAWWKQTWPAGFMVSGPVFLHEREGPPPDGP